MDRWMNGYLNRQTGRKNNSQGQKKQISINTGEVGNQLFLNHCRHKKLLENLSETWNHGPIPQRF